MTPSQSKRLGFWLALAMWGLLLAGPGAPLAIVLLRVAVVEMRDLRDAAVQSGLDLTTRIVERVHEDLDRYHSSR